MHNSAQWTSHNIKWQVDVRLCNYAHCLGESIMESQISNNTNPVIRSTGSRRATDTCFKFANMQGNRFGNCGLQKSGFKKCSEGYVIVQKIKQNKKDFRSDIFLNLINYLVFFALSATLHVVKFNVLT